MPRPTFDSVLKNEPPKREALLAFVAKVCDGKESFAFVASVVHQRLWELAHEADAYRQMVMDLDRTAALIQEARTAVLPRLANRLRAIEAQRGKGTDGTDAELPTSWPDADRARIHGIGCLGVMEEREISDLLLDVEFKKKTAEAVTDALLGQFQALAEARDDWREAAITLTSPIAKAEGTVRHVGDLLFQINRSIEDRRRQRSMQSTPPVLP